MNLMDTNIYTQGNESMSHQTGKGSSKVPFLDLFGDMLVFEEDRDLMESHFLLFGCYFWNICCLYFNEVSLLILILLIGGDAAMLVISCHQ